MTEKFSDSEAIEILTLAHARDAELDQWLANCGDMDRALTARWLLDGSNQEQMPRSLIQAQERLMREIEACS